MSEAVDALSFEQAIAELEKVVASWSAAMSRLMKVSRCMSVELPCASGVRTS